MSTQMTMVGSRGTTNTPYPHDVAASAAVTTRTTWQIEPATTRIEFAIGKRLLLVKRLTVRGRFGDIRGTIDLDEHDPATAEAAVTIGAASIDTQQARRDAHLRGADFFDVERHPTLTFISRRITCLDPAAGRYEVMGDLTIRGITRAVHFMAHYSATTGDAPGSRITLRLTGVLNRRDFGLTWANPLIAIADDVTVTLDVRAVKAHERLDEQERAGSA